MGIEVRLRDLRRSSPRSWACATSTPTAARPRSTGSRPSSTSPTCPRWSAGRTSTARATTSSTSPTTTSPPRLCAGSTRAGPATRPTWATPSASPSKRRRTGHLQRQDRVRVESLKQYFPDDEERPVVPRYIPSWEGHHTSELFEKYPLRSCRRTRASRSTATTTSTPTGSTTSRCTASRRTATLGGRRASIPTDAAAAGHQQQRHRAALQRPRLGALHGGGHRAGPAGRHPQLRFLGPVRSAAARASPTSIDQGGCVSICSRPRA